MKSTVCEIVDKMSEKWCLEKRNPDVKDKDSGGGDAPPVAEDTQSPGGCLSIVVLGASGDLAKKKTFPALFNLYRQVSFPPYLF